MLLESQSFCTVSRPALVCESSHSLCGLSHRAQFGVVVLRLLFEPSCSVWSRRAPGCYRGYKYPCSLNLKGKRAHTLLEEAFWRPKGVLQICLHLQKLQAILSRGRTRESRGIPREKVVVQGKGAEAQEKKDFWHFRCHQSRASPIEENLHRFPSRLLN
ncbi:hypothetical protein Taro_029979 [Colocasia esculenta]|uniref:Uncharacterized protein n=1 Tax=Colocasia esculenta TaxID=4460 RepID=A0A843VMS1_COLES|nr:hypothetical protein [Colocasia esculenta]